MEADIFRVQEREKDCLVDKVNKYYKGLPLPPVRVNGDFSFIKESKLRRLLSWCFGG